MRDWLIANSFGATAEGDIAILLVAVPDLLIGLIGNAGLVTYITARFREEKGRSNEQGRKVLRLYIYYSFLVSLLFSVFCFLFGTKIAFLLAPGFGADDVERAASLLRWIFVCLPVLGAGFVLASWANAEERFGLYAFSNLGFNIPVILGLLLLVFFRWDNALLITVWFIVGGVILRFLFQSLSLVPKKGYSVRSRVPAENKQGWLGISLACISGLVPMLVPLAGRAASSYSGDGGVVVFNLFFKIGELPMVVFGALFATVLLPKMVDRVGHRSFQSLAGNFVFLALIAAGVAALLLGILHKEIVRLFASWTKTPGDFTAAIGAGLPLFLMLLPKTLTIYGSTLLFAGKKYGFLAIATLVFLGLFFGLLFTGREAAAPIEDIYWAMLLAYSAYALGLMLFICGFKMISFNGLLRRSLIAAGIGLAVLVWSSLGQMVRPGNFSSIILGVVFGCVLVTVALMNDRFWGRITRTMFQSLGRRLGFST